MSRIYEDFVKTLRERHHLNNEQLRQFEIFYDVSLTANKRLNLLFRTNVEKLWISLALDSLQALPFLTRGDKILDIGSGNGFPGIALAICMPESKFTLAEQVNKKAQFIDIARDQAGIKNVVVWPGQVQELTNQQFNCIIARAVAPLPQLWMWTNQVRTTGTRYVLFRGTNELKENPTPPDGLRFIESRDTGSIICWVAEVE